MLRGAGAYHDVPNIKVSRVAVFNFQAAVVIWRAAKFFSNHRSIAYLAGISEWLFRNATKSAPLWIHAHRGLGNLILVAMRKALRSSVMLSACVISWPRLRVGKRIRKYFCRAGVAVYSAALG